MSARENRAAGTRVFAVAIGCIASLGANALGAAATYQDIRPLFQSSCLNCHNPDKQKAGLDLSTYDATMDGSDNGKVVEMGDADKSVLYKVLTHAEEPYMPKGGDKLPDSQIALIKQWIEANAPEKAGGIAQKQGAAAAVAISTAATGKPTGPAAMPVNGLLEPVVHTVRRGAVPSVAGSPWAPLVAIAGQKQVLLYNTDTMQLASVLPFPEGFPQIVRFSRNGSLVIAGGGVGAKLGHVTIWDVKSGKRVTQIGDEFDMVLAADISPDQSLVALGGPGKLVKIFSVSDGKLICKMKKHTDWVTALCFTPDGKALISGDRAGGISVWDCQGHELQTLPQADGAITGIACQGNAVATASEDGTVKFWDIAEGKQLKSWHAHDGGARSVAFSQDGRVVTSGRDKLVKLWDASGRLIWKSEALNDIAMEATAAGGKVIAADWTGDVRAWSVDGKIAGELDSNPGRIGDRIDALNKRIADIHAAEPKAQDAVNAAGARANDLSNRAAQKRATLDATAKGLAGQQARLAQLQKDSVGRSAAIRNQQELVAGYGMITNDFLVASALNPIVGPYVFAVNDSGERAKESLAVETASLAATNVATESARKQCATLASQVDGLRRGSAMLVAQAGVATKGIADAKRAQSDADAEIKKIEGEIATLQAAAQRNGQPVQFAARQISGN